MKKTLTAAVAAIAAAATLHAEPLDIGAPLPAIATVDEQGAPLDLPSAGAKGLLLVYFYPKADTPGCTAQACSLRDDYASIQEQGVKIIGVSKDTAAAQKKFKDKYSLPFTLAADPDATIIRAFGVANSIGMAQRTAFLFNPDLAIERDGRRCEARGVPL